MRTSALRQRDLDAGPDGWEPDVADAVDDGRDDDPAIDLVHLARQTLGDRDLETELLGLFARQARALVGVLDAAALSDDTLPPWTADPLHTLCGSARAVGCRRVARRAERLERDLRRAAADGSEPLRAGRTEALKAAVRHACASIDHILGG